jgi:hypothetical protein
MSLNDFYSNWKYFLLFCVTLGLAPFAPEPHIVGKIRWIAGGAVGMTSMDWFDVVLHGTPWVLLIISGSGALYRYFTKKTGNS